MTTDSVKPDPLSHVLDDSIRQFGDLIRHVHRRHGLVLTDVDELEQEIRIRLWRAQQTSEKISSLPASYMYRTAMSAAVDLLRRRRHELRETSLPASGHSREPALETRGSQVETRIDLAAALERAIGLLARPRGVVVRLHLAGYPREEISTMLGWSEAKTRNLLYRGLADLRSRLDEMGVGPEGIR